MLLYDSVLAHLKTEEKSYCEASDNIAYPLSSPGPPPVLHVGMECLLSTLEYFHSCNPGHTSMSLGPYRMSLGIGSMFSFWVDV